MRLWSPKRPRKSRPGSRFNVLFPSQTTYDGGDDHAFSSSSNGYGPQVMSDKGFRPNNLAILPSGDGIATRSSSNYRTDSPVSDSSSTRQKRFEPWSPSTVNEQIDTRRSSREENCELDDEPGPSHDGLWSWIPYVPQSADDDTVLYHVKEVFLFAEQFVVNFYTDRMATCAASQEVLSKVNRSQLLSDGELQTQLSDATYHTTLIRHILISLMLDLISFESVASASLLPKEFQNYIAIAQARTRSNADEITSKTFASEWLNACIDFISRSPACIERLQSFVSIPPPQFCKRPGPPRREKTSLGRSSWRFPISFRSVARGGKNSRRLGSFVSLAHRQNRDLGNILVFSAISVLLQLGDDG